MESISTGIQFCQTSRCEVFSSNDTQRFIEFVDRLGHASGFRSCRRSGVRFVYYHSQLGPEYLRRFFSETNATLSRDYRQAIDWLAQRRFSLLLFGNGDDILQAKAQGLPVNVIDTSGWKEGAALEPAAFTLVLMDKPAHPNASKVFINWLLSREGQMAVRKDGETNDSLRVDISKTDVRPMIRRREGAKYVITWKAEWMDTEPMQKVVNQALGEDKKR